VLKLGLKYGIRFLAAAMVKRHAAYILLDFVVLGYCRRIAGIKGAVPHFSGVWIKKGEAD